MDLYPEISSHIQYGDSTAISGPLKPGLIQRNNCVMAYPLKHAQIGWSAVHDILSVLCCSKVLTHLGAGSCAGLLPIHAGL